MIDFKPDRLVDLIKKYLNAMQSDDIDTVEALSTHSPRLEYPGGMEFGSVRDLLRWSHGRHKGIHHVFERFDFTEAGSGAITAYASGTLQGTFNDDSAFSGVRFIYRFEIRDRQIAETVLWSDISELVLRLRNTSNVQ